MMDRGVEQMRLEALQYFKCSFSGTKQSVLQDPGSAASQPVLLRLSLPPRATEGIWPYTGFYSIQFSLCSSAIMIWIMLIVMD